MEGFILRRLLQGLITLLALSVIVFVLARTTGDPVDLLVPLDAPPETRDMLRQSLGLDKSYPVQYWLFISHAVTGDFGDSIRLKRPAMKLVVERLPNSMRLAVAAIAFALLLAFPLGVTSAIKRGTAVDQGARLLAVLGVTMPSFLVGILLMELVSVKLKLLPTAGIGGIRYYILPAFTMGLFALASLTRLLRSSMLEVLDSEYIRLARLKGLSEAVVIWKHALRNAIIPVLTMAGVYFALMITVAIVVETVFAWPGVGRLSYEAITSRDFPVIQAVVLMAASLVVSVNLLVDIAYAYADPRIRHR